MRWSKMDSLLKKRCNGQRFDSINVKAKSVNPLYLIISKGNEYFEESKKNKYLTLVSTNESKTITTL